MVAQSVFPEDRGPWRGYVGFLLKPGEEFVNGIDGYIRVPEDDEDPYLSNLYNPEKEIFLTVVQGGLVNGEDFSDNQIPKGIFRDFKFAMFGTNSLESEISRVQEDYHLVADPNPEKRLDKSLSDTVWGFANYTAGQYLEMLKLE